MTSTGRLLVGPALALGLVVLMASTVPAQSPAPASAAKSPPLVVAELFTSEGCSTCPPADEVLTMLAGGIMLPDAQVVALSEHVDYWDSLGWRDPFSAALFSQRQNDYDARVFHTDGIFTPQLVVDGRQQMVGSDRAAVGAAILAAARSPKAALAVTARPPANRRVAVTVSGTLPPGLALGSSTDLVIVVAESGLANNVLRGENQGKRLTHTGVVRSLQTVDTIKASDRSVAHEAAIAWSDSWIAARTQVVAILQERASRRIVGAGVAPLR